MNFRNIWNFIEKRLKIKNVKNLFYNFNKDIFKFLLNYCIFIKKTKKSQN